MSTGRWRQRWLLLALVLWAMPAPQAASQQKPKGRVAIVVGPLASYEAAADALAETLSARGHTCITIRLPKGRDEKAEARAVRQLVDARPTIIATTGAKATSLAVGHVPDIPVIFCLVPNALDADFVAEDSPHRARIAGVTGDIAPETRIDWVLKLQPECHRLGIPYSPRSEKTMEAIKAAAEARKIAVTPVATERDDFQAAAQNMKNLRCDGVVMLPDPKVYNAKNVQHLILWGVRYKRCVWGFSGNVVKAGAVAAQFFDPSAVGTQVAELIERAIGGESPAAIGIHNPKVVKQAVNGHTARLVGVELANKDLDKSVARYGEGK